MYNQVLLDWRNDSWRPIIIVYEEQQQLLVKKFTADAGPLINDVACDIGTDCSNEGETNNEPTIVPFLHLLMELRVDTIFNEPLHSILMTMNYIEK